MGGLARLLSVGKTLQIAHGTPLRGKHRRLELVLFQPLRRNRGKEINGFLRGIAFAQVATGTDGLPRVTAAPEFSQEAVCLATMMGSQNTSQTVTIGVNLEPDDILF